MVRTKHRDFHYWKVGQYNQHITTDSFLDVVWHFRLIEEKEHNKKRREAYERKAHMKRRERYEHKREKLK